MFRIGAGVWVLGMWMAPALAQQSFAGADFVEQALTGCHDGVHAIVDAEIEQQSISFRAGPREVRVFFNHHFHIGANEVGDTALYSPETQSLIHYKEDVYFLVNCAAQGAAGVQHFACGTSESGGQEGTWRDAEDGELSRNPIAQGSVDSTLGITLTLPAIRALVSVSAVRMTIFSGGIRYCRSTVLSRSMLVCERPMTPSRLPRSC